MSARESKKKTNELNIFLVAGEGAASSSKPLWVPAEAGLGASYSDPTQVSLHFPTFGIGNAGVPFKAKRQWIG